MASMLTDKVLASAQLIFGMRYWVHFPGSASWTHMIGSNALESAEVRPIAGTFCPSDERTMSGPITYGATSFNTAFAVSNPYIAYNSLGNQQRTESAKWA